MSRIHLFTVPLLLAVSASAWAGGGPYPATIDTPSTRTRAEVVTDLREAQRLGQMSSVDYTFPVYRGEMGPDGVFIVWGDRHELIVRERVRAETRMAAAFGLLSFGEGDPPIATAEQERLIAEAGQRAADRARLA
jgi:hypothetical protein